MIASIVAFGSIVKNDPPHSRSVLTASPSCVAEVLTAAVLTVLPSTVIEVSSKSTLALTSLSPLLVNFILNAPLSAVSAGKALVTL